MLIVMFVFYTIVNIKLYCSVMQIIQESGVTMLSGIPFRRVKRFL
jgi:uncharacterized protein YqfA (UPF0365 family)